MSALPEIKLDRTGPDSWKAGGLIVLRVKSRGFGTNYHLYGPMKKVCGEEVLGDEFTDCKTLAAIRTYIYRALALHRAMNS